MLIKQNVTFPCGLKSELELRFFDVFGSYTFEDLICPIHKEKCKKGVR